LFSLDEKAKLKNNKDSREDKVEYLSCYSSDVQEANESRSIDYTIAV